MPEWGNAAIDDFGAAQEGPGGSAKFGPLAKILKSHGIKKRWYFHFEGENWSRNVLLVLDDQAQMWGFMMGYSE
jgi:hypothetical protein